MKKIIAVLAGLAGAAGILLLAVGGLIGRKSVPAVIGGASGPTSIFLAAKINGAGLMEMGAVLLAAGLAIGLIVRLIIRLKRK